MNDHMRPKCTKIQLQTILMFIFVKKYHSFKFLWLTDDCHDNAFSLLTIKESERVVTCGAKFGNSKSVWAHVTD